MIPSLFGPNHRDLSNHISDNQCHSFNQCQFPSKISTVGQQDDDKEDLGSSKSLTNALSEDSHSDDGFNSSISEESEDHDRYEFRQTVRERATAFVGAWIDRDTTGNYDPITERRRLLQNSLKRKRTVVHHQGDPDPKSCADTRTKTQRTLLLARRHEINLIVALKFHSPKARLELKKYHRGIPIGQAISEEVDESSLPLHAKYKLRSRQYANNEDNEAQVDLTGHPAARGCKGCRDIGEPCTMLEPQRIYPCYLCKADGHDCELVVPPKKKRPCERCKNRRLHCSYLDTDNHDSPCRGCRESGFKCIAGPYIDPMHTRLTANGRPGTIHELPAPQKRRNITKSDEKFTGSTLEDAHFPSKTTFLDESSQENRQDHENSLRERDLSTAPVLAMEAVQLKSLPMSATRSKRPRRKNISTKLIHPIKFNYVDVTGTKPCHFCDDPIYAIVGTGEMRSITVEEEMDGTRWREIDSERLGSRAEPSRCCQICTSNRNLIVSCDRHHMRPIPLLSKEYQDWPTTFSRLLKSKPGSEREDLMSKFCSICPNLAHFECLTPVTLQASSSAPRGKVGCGLRLCQICEFVFSQVYEGDLQTMVTKMKPDREFWPSGLRADYDFFGKDSYMVKQIMHI